MHPAVERRGTISRSGSVRRLLETITETMRDTPTSQQAPASGSRSQQARALIRNRLVRISRGPVCSCHPGGGHPTEEPPVRDTIKILHRY